MAGQNHEVTAPHGDSVTVKTAPIFQEELKPHKIKAGMRSHEAVDPETGQRRVYAAGETIMLTKAQSLAFADKFVPDDTGVMVDPYYDPESPQLPTAETSPAGTTMQTGTAVVGDVPNTVTGQAGVPEGSTPTTGGASRPGPQPVPDNMSGATNTSHVTPGGAGTVVGADMTQANRNLPPGSPAAKTAQEQLAAMNADKPEALKPTSTPKK
jgi:hypothetical protein